MARMPAQLHTGDTVFVLATGEIGLVVGFNRTYPVCAVVSLGTEGLWTFPIDTVDRVDDLQSAPIAVPRPRVGG
jgi:hypothetical protein